MSSIMDRTNSQPIIVDTTVDSNNNDNNTNNNKNNNNTHKKRILLFGTSADPPTGEGGHVGIAKALSALVPEWCDEVRILPVYRHSFETKRDRLLPFCDRINMCELAFQGIPNVVVSDSERICYEQTKIRTRENTSSKSSTSTNTTEM